jgi:hypothetical protein
MHCNVPRLHNIPNGKWKCCECVAPTYTRRQRCGECADCLQPHCGKCVSCKSFKQFGGDGKYGGACKLRKCKFMRFAAPEVILLPADHVGRLPSTGTVTLTRKKVTKRAAAITIAEGVGENSNKKRRAAGGKIIPSRVSNTDGCASAVKIPKSSNPLCKRDNPPGPGWVSKRVYEYGQWVYHWISPIRNIEFRMYTAACIFERVRHEFGNDEFKGWEEYRKWCKAYNKNTTRVIDPQQYDANPKWARRSLRAGRSRVRGSPKGVTASKRGIRTSRNNAIINGKTKPPSVGRDSSNSNSKKRPGPGWKRKCCKEGNLAIVTHWISPVRRIEFKRRKAAEIFEKLRIEFGTDEIEAWEELRKRSRNGFHLSVVSPKQYDAKPNCAQATSTRRVLPTKCAKISMFGKSNENLREEINSTVPTNATETCAAKSMSVGRNKSHPGPGWKPKKVKETNQFVTHWISPTRQIVFRRRRAACNFESLRREFGTDEVEAWEVFRKQYYSKAKGHPAFVVSPQDYDAPSNNASVHQSNVQEDGQRDPSVGEDFAAHRDSGVENGSTRSAHDNGGGKRHINHISTSIRHHVFLTLLANQLYRKKWWTTHRVEAGQENTSCFEKDCIE